MGRFAKSGVSGKLQRVAAMWILAALAGFAVYAAAQTKVDRDPIGLWRTVDDKTGQPKGEVRIFSRDGSLFGQIERVFDSKDAASRCDECRDERRGQKIEGLLILRGMKLVNGEYRGGDILDPDTGRVYQCRMKLTDGGQKLAVRGFLGVSLLGRTQTWTRVEPGG